jgi:hypothetical protein
MGLHTDIPGSKIERFNLRCIQSSLLCKKAEVSYSKLKNGLADVVTTPAHQSVLHVFLSGNLSVLSAGQLF